MVKAHSLLYAIYICLIVAVICSAVLYFASLFSQLNLHYNLKEEMYLHNQSLVNYALGNVSQKEEMPVDPNSGIAGTYQIKKYGLLALLRADSHLRGDTISSIGFAGSHAPEGLAIYMANLSKPLYYSGAVVLSGKKMLPALYIEAAHINSEANKLTNIGETALSQRMLPALNPDFHGIFKSMPSATTALHEVGRQNDSLYFNSFLSDTKEIMLSGSSLSNISIKGNFVIRSRDSIRVSKSATLEDVILIAPKITFEQGFTGSLQAFSTNGLDVHQEVTLNYPSVVCVYNETAGETKIRIAKNCRISGAVVLFGAPENTFETKMIDIEPGGLIVGDIYCHGKLLLKSNLYGTVYTQRFYFKNASASYENTVANVEINSSKRPGYFIGIPLFETNSNSYGILKKLL